jgi:hypothetical protein
MTGTIDYICWFAIPAAYSLLPDEMQSAEATAIVLAIGLQESKFQYRHQVGGPALGFWQFEAGGGVRGVLQHRMTRPIIASVLRSLQYDPGIDEKHAHALLEHNDTLAASFARLLLWTSPQRLYGPNETELAWDLYMETWRPGKPHHATWESNYKEAWRLAIGHDLEPESKA